MNLPNYYAILGLPQSASQEEIKKRYRELARRYHPDVAKTPDSAGKFKEINEANSVLSDPQKRANYDAGLKLAGFRAQRPAAENPASSRPGADGSRASPNAQRPGETARPRSPSPPFDTPRATSQPQRQAPAGVDTLIAEAQRAFARLKYREAEILCRKANRIVRTSAAFEILGDIYRMRGRGEEAIAMYSYALQLDRSNRSVQVKFDRMVGQPSGATMAGNAARAARRTSLSLPALTPARALVTGIGVVLIAFLVVVVGLSRNPPAPDIWVFDWDPLLIFALAAAGLLGGFEGSVNGLLASARGELASSRPFRERTSAVPLGAVLLGFALIFFYAAFLLYVALGFLQETLSKSVLLAFAVSFLLTLVFALVSRVSAPWILLSGGNVVFLAFVAGWGIGDALHRQL